MIVDKTNKSIMDCISAADKDNNSKAECIHKSVDQRDKNLNVLKSQMKAPVHKDST